MKRFALASLVLPIVALLGLWALPLALGSRTLYLRDVLNTHLPMKAAQAAAMRAGDLLPLVDPYRAGGQPLLGNPNAVPLYPDNLLYLVGPVLWALNAHFWLHLLLAPFAMYWLARAFGLPRSAAWAAGVVYALCGYTLSNLNFYNLIAGVALTPAFVAAVLAARAPSRRSRFALAGGLWALLLLGGEPLLASLALALAAAALAVAPRGDRSGAHREWALPLLAALACGTLIAMPQLVELWRILPLSLRGWRGYAGDAGEIGSLNPRQALDWLLPFPFGRPDLLRGGAFWGERFYSGKPPIYFSLYPGLLAWGLVLTSGSPRRRPAALWAWGAMAAGGFFALGAANPLARPLFRLGLLRYPIKFWLLVAVGAALLAGLGWARAFPEDAADASAPASGSPYPARPLRRVLQALAVAIGAFWLWLTLAPAAAQGALRAWIPATRSDAFVAGERLRWAGVSLLSFLLAVLLLVALEVARRSPRQPKLGAWGAAALLVVHAGGQMLLLRPLLATDDSAPYGAVSPLLAELPAPSRVVHGGFANLFGAGNLQEGEYAKPEIRFVERRAFAELYPFAGMTAQRRYEFNTSPEGLDAFLTRLAQATLEKVPDASRIWLLRSWGVERLLLGRALAPEAAALVTLLRVLPEAGTETYAYALRDPVAGVRFVGTLVPAADANAAFAVMLRPDFDPRTVALVPGQGEVERGTGGVATVVEDSTARVEAQVQADSAGLLVIERAYLSLYRATVDGAPAATEIANVCRLGVRVPAGAHRVVVELDRRPTRWALAAALVGALGLAILALTVRRRASLVGEAGGG